MKKIEFPLIKFRDGDRMPGVWLSQGFWFLIREALCRKYFDARAGMGDRQARIDLKKADVMDLWPFDKGTADDAIRYYRIGWEAYEQDRKDKFVLSPEDLVLMGNRKETEAYEKVKVQLGKEIANEHAA